MPCPCNLRIPGCPGSSEKEGREDTSDIFEIEHEVHAPTSPETGQPMGSRIHGALRLVKQIDKASPRLHEAVCKGESFKEVTLDFYRISPETRQEVKYYTITMKKVMITQIRPYMPNTLVAANERLQHMEQISLVYQEIEWHWLPDRIMASDKWEKPGAGDDS